MAKDLFHNAIRVALQKENWIINDDPLKLGAGGANFEIDLGAEHLLAADRGEEKIAILFQRGFANEIKTFAGESLITDYHAALGQFLNYRLALELNGIDRYRRIASFHSSIAPGINLFLRIREKQQSPTDNNIDKYYG